mmetsp:Transcript_114501/g.365107  ORF Transcript_114501/g.365107 Transcript_114501/m.365107 type:complete len:247 (-) Transcript_114501:587-1327(-)
MRSSTRASVWAFLASPRGCAPAGAGSGAATACGCSALRRRPTARVAASGASRASLCCRATRAAARCSGSAGWRWRPGLLAGFRSCLPSGASARWPACGSGFHAPPAPSRGTASAAPRRAAWATCCTTPWARSPGHSCEASGEQPREASTSPMTSSARPSRRSSLSGWRGRCYGAAAASPRRRRRTGCRRRRPRTWRSATPRAGPTLQCSCRRLATWRPRVSGWCWLWPLSSPGCTWPRSPTPTCHG